MVAAYLTLYTSINARLFPVRGVVVSLWCFSNAILVCTTHCESLRWHVHFFLRERPRSVLLKDVKPFTCTATVLSTTINIYGLSASRTHMLTRITAHIATLSV